MPDLQFYNAGSFVLCTPMTEAGANWMHEHLPGEEFGETRNCIEFRYLEEIVLGARADGLICEG